MATAHPLDHVCRNCYYWSSNRVHPASSRYMGSVCLERVGDGFTYKTTPSEGCSNFQRLAGDDNPVVLQGVDTLTLLTGQGGEQENQPGA